VTPAEIADPALRFWLDYIEAKGGLYDVGDDKALAVLPETVRGPAGLTEEVTVTAEPEVAREDGALLLIPGHPVLDQAVEDVLARGDVDRYELKWPRQPPPSPSALLERARADIVIDHGRIDLAPKPPSSVYLPILRLGVVVTYWMSLEDRFQEREEVWVDARSGVALPERVLRSMGAEATGVPDGGSRRFLPTDLSRAVTAAHAHVYEAVTARREDLARHSRRAREQELARAAAYYDSALDSIARRSESAEAERRALLEAQADATRVERARRLREIEDKFRPRHEIRPFRLHQVCAPVVQFPVLVRRGPRQFPFELIWMPCAVAFLPAPCPHCGKLEVLVAGKHFLGCRSCLPQAAPASRAPSPQPRPAPDSHPSESQASADSAMKPTPHPLHVWPSEHGTSPMPKPVAGHGPHRREPNREGPVASRVVEKAGNKLARALWRAGFEERRWRAKAMIAHSPMSAMTRLYGPDAPLRAVGFALQALPIPPSTRVGTSLGSPARPHSTAGIVWGTDRRAYLFTLRWHLGAGAARLAEVLVGVGGREAALPNRRDLPPEIASRVFQEAPVPRIDLDPVARVLWDAAIASHGLPFIARCLCVWWRIAESGASDRLSADALAAAVMRWVTERSRLRSRDQLPVAGPGIDARAVDAAATALEELIGPEAVTW
jgi:hypothetical protein